MNEALSPPVPTAASAGTAAAPTPARAYNAFISYSHAADDQLAPALQAALHGFAKPWWRMRALRVFRDKTSLAADPALWATIQRALADSEWFIYLASPGAAQSHWVNLEVQWWLQERSAERLLIVLTDGELVWDRAARDFDSARTTALPPALRGRFAEEPNFVDLRFAKAHGSEDQRSLRHARFRAAILDLAAPIHGVSKDLLDGADVHQHRRTRRVAAAVGVALLLLATTATAFGVVAKRKSDEAEQARQVALSRQLAARAQMLAADQRVDDALLHAVEARRALTPGGAAAADEHYDWMNGLMTTLAHRGAPLAAHLPGGGEVALSADGQTVATARGKDITLWERASGRLLQRLPPRPDFVFQMAWTADGAQLLVSTLREPTVSFIDARTGQDVGPPVALQDDGAVLAVSPDGRWLAASAGGRTTLFALPSRAPSARALPVLPTSVAGLAFDPASQHLALGTVDGRVQVLSLATGQPLGAPLARPLPAVAALAFSPDGRHLVAGGEAGLAVWAWPSGRRLWAEDQAGDVRTLAVSPDGRSLATGNGAAAVQRWQLLPDAAGRGQPLGEPLLRHSEGIVSLAFTPDGGTLVSGGGDQLGLLWDLTRAQRLTSVLTRGGGPVETLDVRHDGTAAAAAHCLDEPPPGAGQGCERSAVRLVPLAQGAAGTPTTLDARFAGLPMDLRFVTGRDELLVADCEALADDGCSRVGVGRWNAAGQRVAAHHLAFGDARFSAVALSPDGQHLAAVGHRSGASAAAEPVYGLWLWTVGTAAPRVLVEGGENEVFASVGFSPDGQTVVASTLDHSRLWQVSDGRLLGPALDGTQPAISPDGRRVAVYIPLPEAERRVEVIDIATMQRLTLLPLDAKFRAHTLGWSTDGRTLAVAGNDDDRPDHSVLAWFETSLGRRIGPVLRWPGGIVTRLAFRPGDTALLLGHDGGELVLVDLDPLSWQARACRIANRNLGFDEWQGLMGRTCYRPTCADLPLPADLASAPQRLARRGDAEGARQATHCAAKAAADGRP